MRTYMSERGSKGPLATRHVMSRLSMKYNVKLIVASVIHDCRYVQHDVWINPLASFEPFIPSETVSSVWRSYSSSLFPIGSVTSLLVETNHNIISALRDAIALARTLAYCSRGRLVSNVALQKPRAAAAPVDDLPRPLRVEERSESDAINISMREWFFSQAMTVVLDPRMLPDGEVRQAEPQIIRLRYDVRL